jgi:hypothetical protein
MTSKISVSDIVWDGSHFTARSEHGVFEGMGACHLNLAATGGNIAGTVQRGPEAFVGRRITIDFESNTGFCTVV